MNHVSHSYRAAILQAVADEPELPGDMPDEMWDGLCLIMENKDREAMSTALRITVQQTKRGIRERIESITQSPGPCDEAWALLEEAAVPTFNHHDRCHCIGCRATALLNRRDATSNGVEK